MTTPQLSARQLIARPGSLPTVTIPVTDRRAPDAAVVWDYLRAPAEFFGMPMPEVGEVASALTGYLTAAGPAGELAAMTVTIADDDGAARILVSSAAVRPWRTDPVRITDVGPDIPTPRATDPWWRRMAARTTSLAPRDQIERWLNGRGFADGLAAGVPLLGALVFESGSDVVGVENPEPVSVLDQLVGCGAIAAVDRMDVCPHPTGRVWWISPEFETHPVAELDGARPPVDADAVPSFRSVP